jgi:hypothetical protein
LYRLHGGWYHLHRLDRFDPIPTRRIADRLRSIADRLRSIADCLRSIADRLRSIADHNRLFRHDRTEEDLARRWGEL